MWFQKIFNLVQRILQIPTKIIRETTLKVVQRNGFFAQQENVLFGMLKDSNEETQILRVYKVISICQKLSSSTSLNDGAMFECRNEEHSSKSACDTFSTVPIFDLPIVNQTATSYNKMVNLNYWQQQPPTNGHLTDLDIKQSRVKPWKLNNPCHNQSVERHVKLITEA